MANNPSVNENMIEKAAVRFNMAETWPDSYWFEVYKRGNNLYVNARWGWADGDTRHGDYIGPIDAAIEVLLRHYDFLCPTAQSSLQNLISTYRDKYSKRLEEVIKG